jgi:acyl-CoA thioesterase YciA
MKNFQLITQHICLEKDIGNYGNLFGGIMMSWLDEAAAILTYKTARSNRMVTLLVERLEFIQPVKVGDVVVLSGRVIKIGTTSITVEISVSSLDPETQTERKVCETKMVFVNIDKWGNKAPIKISQTEKDLINDQN